MRLIVNADDLGSSPKVNDAIFSLMQRGITRSASILANGGAADEAIERARTYPQCSFGVHLNVTDGSPLSALERNSPLLDSEGKFRRDAAWALASRSAIRKAIFHEWCAQIEYLQKSGVQLSHVDSHHHLHTNPWLFGILKKVQRKSGLRRVRIALNLRGSADWRKRLWGKLLRMDGTKTTRYFGSLTDYRGWAATGRAETDSMAEIMIHPGLNKYAEETDMLLSDWWDDHIRTNPIISYREL